MSLEQQKFLGHCLLLYFSQFGLWLFLLAIRLIEPDLNMTLV